MNGKISLNKTHLQLIAVLAMVTDHIAWGFFEFWSPAGQVMHVIGRLTIPIMCFFIAEGFKKTHNLYKYLGRLAAFDVLSVVPFYLFFHAEFGHRQNILFDHMLSILALVVLEHKTMKKWAKVLVMVFVFSISILIAGWPVTPILFTLSFYYGKTFKEKAKWFAISNIGTVAAVMAAVILNKHLHFLPVDWTWYDRSYLLGFLLALPLLACYNGQKGKPLLGRYFFYCFYPAHLLVLFFVKYIAQGNATAYDIYLWIHIISLLMVLVMLVWVFRAKSSKMQTAIALFFVLEGVYILGFIIEILATTVETFYMACVVEYFGELLMLVAFLIFASECGRIRIPLFVYIAHVLAALALVYSIALTPQTHFFYKEIILTTVDGHIKATFVHSTGYYLSAVYTVFVIAEMMMIFINSLIKGTKIEKRRVGMLAAVMMFIWIPYAITLSGITGGYELPVIGVIGAGVLLLICFNRYGALDAVAIVSESALAKAEEGVIIIDDRLFVTFSNALARQIVGNEAIADTNAGRNEMIRNILSGNTTEARYGGRVYEIRLEELKHASYNQGYTIWFIDATKQRKLLDEAKNIANHDALTGLYNRRHFERLVVDEIAAKKTGTLIITDMDNFKIINDTYGHKRGDNVLTEYAGILKEYPEEELFSCRIGGDEFMIYLRGITDLKKTEELIGHIMEAFGHRFRDDKVKCTLSAGAAVNADPDNLSDFSALYNTADKNLYAAKGNGKNTYVLETPPEKETP
jgi:diguanylate cyclase (GGDEF)-like protein